MGLFSYTIDYSNLPDGPEKEEKALNDLAAYIGSERYANIVRICEEEKFPPEFIEKSLSVLGGISGYPAKVFARKYGNPVVEIRKKRKVND